MRTLLPYTALLALTACPAGDPSLPAESTNIPAVAAAAATANAASNATANATAQMGELVLHVDGLTCEGCAWQIRETLEKLEGIETVQTSVADKRVVVTYDPAKANTAAVVKALEGVGYEAAQVAR